MKWCIQHKKKHLFYTYLLKKIHFDLLLHYMQQCFTFLPIYVTMIYFFTNLCKQCFAFLPIYVTMFHFLPIYLTMCHFLTYLCNNGSFFFVNLFNNGLLFLPIYATMVHFFFTNLCINVSPFYLYICNKQCLSFQLIYATMFENYAVSSTYQIYHLQYTVLNFAAD